METRGHSEWDLFIVLDFEATCEQNKANQYPQEIIEFPSVVVNARTLEVCARIQLYVRPVRRAVSNFCTSLTGITQETVDKAETFPTVFEQYIQWLSEVTENHTKKFCFVTCGDWDLKTMLPAQLKLCNLQAPEYFSRWINIKETYQQETGKRAEGMVGMLTNLGIELEGRHHSGIDDCQNISSILIRLLESGKPITYTHSWRGVCHYCGSSEHFQYDCPEYHSTQQERPLDWMCSCGGNNFARRLECYLCSKPRADGSCNQPSSMTQQPRVQQARAGDWFCSCGEMNFARRVACRTCNSKR